MLLRFVVKILDVVISAGIALVPEGGRHLGELKWPQGGITA